MPENLWHLISQLRHGQPQAKAPSLTIPWSPPRRRRLRFGSKTDAPATGVPLRLRGYRSATLNLRDVSAEALSTGGEAHEPPQRVPPWEGPLSAGERRPP